MKLLKALICISLIISSLLLCACSGRKKVTVIQGNNNPPETKKSVDETDKERESKALEFSDDITVAFLDEKFTLKTPNASYDFKYADVEEFSYMTEWNYEADVLVEGEQSDIEINAKMRTTENEYYFLSVFKTTPVYISVCYSGDVYIFNLDTTAATKDCYQTLKSHVG